MNARNMAMCAVFAALPAVCVWLAVPAGDIVFSMQTFGVFLALGLLGGKRAPSLFLCIWCWEPWGCRYSPASGVASAL